MCSSDLGRITGNIATVELGETAASIAAGRIATGSLAGNIAGFVVVDIPDSSGTRRPGQLHESIGACCEIASADMLEGVEVTQPSAIAFVYSAASPCEVVDHDRSVESGA